MRKLKLAVMISGSGTNLQAIIDACNTADYPAEIMVVISNRPLAKGLDRARASGIKAVCIDHTQYDDRTVFEADIHACLKENNVELVCLAGFMRLLGSDFVGRWKDRMINIHPSLLPSYKGLHTHQRAIEDGARFGGCTLHFVRPEMDDGPIIMQAAVPIAPEDTEESLIQKVLVQEHIIYKAGIRMIAEGCVRVSGRRCVFKDTNWPQGSLISPAP